MSLPEKHHYPDPCIGCFQEQNCKDVNAKCELWFDWAKHEGKIKTIRQARKEGFL